MIEEAVERIVLLGAAGHGRDVLDAARAQGRCVVGFLDDNERLHGTIVNGIPVLGGLEWLLEHRDVQVIPTVDNPAAKRKFAEFFERNRTAVAPPIIHPHAYVSRDAQVGDGTIILMGSSIQPQVKIGHHVSISTLNTLGHDVIAEDFVSTHPGVQIGGEVTLGMGSFIGMGATILPRVKIGEWTTVGAGAVVIGDLPAYCTAVGVPARVIKRHEPNT